MATDHEWLEYHLDDMDEMIDSCFVEVKILEVYPDTNTADVEHATYGEMFGVPIFYHCEDVTNVDQGHKAFVKDDQAIMFCRRGRENYPGSYPVELQIVAHADGRPRWCTWEHWSDALSDLCKHHQWSSSFVYPDGANGVSTGFGWCQVTQWMSMSSSALKVDMTGGAQYSFQYQSLHYNGWEADQEEGLLRAKYIEWNFKQGYVSGSGDPDESGFHIFLKDEFDNSAEIHIVCWTEDVQSFMDAQPYRFWGGFLANTAYVRPLSDFGHPNRFGADDPNGFVNLKEVALRLETGDGIQTVYECDYLDFY